jgi:hypothetical protein
VKLTGYAYPWDFVGNDEVVARIAALDLDAVAVAATYHAARLGSPLHPSRRVIEIADSACYVPVRDEAWRGQRLRPASPDWLEDDDAFGKASDVLASSGIATDAWVVLCHDDTLGRLHPDLVTRNAFGDRYPYALCPSSPDVREYAETLAEEVVLAHRVRGVVLEACGPVGVEHASLHDKVEFASWTPTDLDLLSLCFCDACRLAMSTVGLDADELAARVRAAVGGAALSVEEALGADVASTLATFRRGLVTTLLRGCVERVTHASPDARVTVHGAGDPWTTGSFCALESDGALEGVDAVVAYGWDDETRLLRLAQLREIAGDSRALGTYLRLDKGWPSDDVRGESARLTAAGVDEIHLYHLGLWPEAHWQVARDVAAALREEIA